MTSLLSAAVFCNLPLDQVYSILRVEVPSSRSQNLVHLIVLMVSFVIVANDRDFVSRLDVVEVRSNVSTLLCVCLLYWVGYKGEQTSLADVDRAGVNGLGGCEANDGREGRENREGTHGDGLEICLLDGSGVSETVE